MINRLVLLGSIFFLLPGCKIQTEMANRDGAIQVANKENAVHVEKDALGHVEQGAVTVSKDAVHVEKDALHVEKDAIGHVEAGAVKVEQGAVTLTGTMQQGAIQAPLTVQTGAVQMPLTTNVAEGAMKVNLQLQVAEGAIVIKGAEAGAIQTKIETPWWAWVMMGLFGIGWLITKFRKHKTRSRDISGTNSVVEFFF